MTLKCFDHALVRKEDHERAGEEVECLRALAAVVRGCGLVVDVEAGTVTGQGIHLTAGEQPEA